MNKENIKISGMTCAACAKRIEKTVGKLDGVTDAAVNFATEKLSVEYDDSKTDLGKIKETIEKIGYKVTDRQKNNIRIPIGGMTCAACAARLEKTLSKTEGIIDARVNLASEKAFIEYDPAKIRASNIRQVIEKTGYKALSSENDKPDEDRIRKENEMRTMWK